MNKLASFDVLSFDKHEDWFNFHIGHHHGEHTQLIIANYDIPKDKWIVLSLAVVDNDEMIYRPVSPTTHDAVVAICNYMVATHD